MIIERIQVEEGFLNGLDLTFKAGLNVLIGPRGSGKTSIIELIRFCLGVKGYTERSDSKAREHALSILGSGQVTVTLSVDGEPVFVTRTGTEEDPRRSREHPVPLIFSQNEIEAVGLHAPGRLKIIDGFRQASSSRDARITPLLSQIRSFTTEAKSLADELETINEQLAALATVPDQLREAEQEQQSTLESASASAAKQRQLQPLNEAGTAAAVRSKVLERALTTARDLNARVNDLLAAQFALDQWPTAAGPTDQLTPVRAFVNSARKQVEQARALLLQAIESVERLRAVNQEQRLEVDQQARQLRRSLEEVKAGAGAAAKRVSDLREKLGQMSALKTLMSERSSRLEAVRMQRNLLLDDLENVRKERFDERTAVVSRLNQELGPRINVTVERAGLYQEYIDAISAALRGSGLHYSTLAPVVAARMSPRELVEAVESRNVQALCSLVELAPDRASRVIGELASRGTESILTSGIDESVTMSLLDGTEYKTTENLSTGQRCTIILPILLGHHGQVLVVDQPEDNLDNAFIVDTLIEAIRKRGQDGQLLFSTHNANIPVLGEAQQVVLLGSDGRRGFIRHLGALDDPKSVDAITTVMEGGRQAFLRRARFYQDRMGKEDG